MEIWINYNLLEIKNTFLELLIIKCINVLSIIEWCNSHVSTQGHKSLCTVLQIQLTNYKIKNAFN